MEVKIMSLIKCPECGKEISDTAKSCPNCGYKLNTDFIKRKTIGKRLFIFGLIAFLGDGIIELSMYDKYILPLKAYAITHNGYYPTSFRIFTFFTSVATYGGIILIVIGILMMIIYRNKK